MLNTFVLCSIYASIALVIFFYTTISLHRNLKLILSIGFALLYYAFFSFANITRYLHAMHYSSTSLIVLFSTFIVLFFINEEDIIHKITLTIYPHLCMVFTHCISLIALSYLYYENLQYHALLSEHATVLCITESSVFTLLLLLFCFINKKRQAIFPVLLISLDCLLQILTNYFIFHNITLHEIILITISISSLGMIIVFYFHSLQKKEKENQILNAQLNDEEYYKIAKEDLHAIKHDLKHVLSTIDAYDTSTKEALHDTYATKLDNVTIPIHTGIQTLDTILNSKLQAAQQKGIQLQTIFNIIEVPKIDEEDLSILFINLLDNAIEHCGSKKEILLEMTTKSSHCTLHIHNSIDQPVLDEDGNFKNITKTENHGYGISSIQSIVKKYNGSIHYKETINTLTCDISLLFIDK